MNPRGVRLADYRVTARNTSATSDNKIHDDTVARRYGFRGGLVPGVTVYAYVTRPVVEALGADWLARGTASVKFVKPIFDGEEVVVSGVVRETAGSITVELTASTAANGDCAIATATLPDSASAAPAAADYEPGPLPAERCAPTRECLASLGPLGAVVQRYDEQCARAFLDKVGDPHRLYGGSDGLVHPAFILNQANQVLKSNVTLGPWIHTGSAIRHLSAARVDETLSLRGRVGKLTEKKGAQIAELDLLLVADGSRPVAHVYHSAIYSLPAPASA